MDNIFIMDCEEEWILVDIYHLKAKHVDKGEDLKLEARFFEKENQEKGNCECDVILKDSVISPTLVTNFSCNYSCEYCYEGVHKDDISRLTPDKVDHMLNFYEELGRQYGRTYSFDCIRLIGGEPLLCDNKDILKYIVNNIEYKKIEITTNGVNILEYKDFFLKCKGKILVKVSVDGIKEVHSRYRRTKIKDAYEKTMQGIEWLVNNGITVMVMSVYNAEELRHYVAFFDELEKIGWLSKDNMSVAFIPRIGGGADDIENSDIKRNLISFEELSKIDIRAQRVKFRGLFPGASRFAQVYMNRAAGFTVPYRCSALYRPDYAFLPNGKVLVCLSAKGEEGVVGTFFPRVTIDIDRIERLKRRSVLKLEKCSKCTYVNFCGGGCVANVINRGKCLEDTLCGPWQEPEFMKYGDRYIYEHFNNSRRTTD